jgi:hypothetical protein
VWRGGVSSLLPSALGPTLTDLPPSALGRPRRRGRRGPPGRPNDNEREKCAKTRNPSRRTAQTEDGIAIAVPRLGPRCVCASPRYSIHGPTHLSKRSYTESAPMWSPRHSRFLNQRLRTAEARSRAELAPSLRGTAPALPWLVAPSAAFCIGSSGQSDVTGGRPRT